MEQQGIPETTAVEQPTEFKTFTPQEDPILLPQEEQERVMFAEAPKSGPVGVADKEGMALAISLASQGKTTKQDALTALMVEGANPTTIRNHAATILADEAQSAADGFNREAALGRVAEAEMLARKYEYVESLRYSDRPIEKDISRVTTEAAANVSITSQPTRVNNTPQQFAQVISKEGTNKAIEEVISTHMMNRGALPTKGEVLTTLGVALGTPLAATAVSGPIAALLGAGVGAKFAYDAFAQIPKALEEVSGIQRSKGLGYAENIARWRAVLETLPPEKAIAEIEAVTDWLIKNETLPGAAGKVFALMNVARLYDSFDDTDWGKFQLSLKLQEKLDMLGIGFDAAGALSFIKNANRADKTLGKLRGGKEVGRVVAGDMINGTDNLAIPAADRTGYALSFDPAQYIPDGVVGTSAEVQNALKNDVDNLVSILRDRVSIENSDDVSKMRDFISRNAEKYNGAIHAMNPSTGEIILQHPRGAPYISREVAQSAAAKWEAETGIKFEIVPANEFATEKITKAAMLEAATPAVPMSKLVKDIDNEDLIGMWDELDAFGYSPMASDIITAVRTGSSQDADLVELAKLLDKNSALANVEVKIVESMADWNKVPGVSGVDTNKIYFGKYAWQDNSIYILRGAETSPRLLMHEIMHAAVSQAIDVVRSGDKAVMDAAKITATQRKAVGNLRGIYEDLAGQMTPDQMRLYGMHDVHEMISEAFTNKEFQNVLKNMKLSEETAETMGLGRTVKNAWQAITKTLASIFGIPLERSNALTAILEETATLMQRTPQKYQDLASALRGKVDDLDIEDILNNGEKAAKESSLSHGWVLKKAGDGGLHTKEDIDSRLALGGDPVHRASRAAVDDRTISLIQENKERAALTAFIAKNINSLNKKELARVIGVLEEGNDLEKDFNAAELVARGVKSDKEQQAYFAYRALSNLNLDLKNEAINASLSRKGFVQGYIRDGLLQHKAPAKQVDAAEFEGRKAFNLITQEMEKIDPASLKGKFLLQTAKTVEYGDKGAFTLFIGDNTTVRFGALKNQIPKRPGTFRRIYTDDNFGRVKTTAVVNGESMEDSLHLRTSKSKRDMDKWAEGMNTILTALKNEPGIVDLAFIERAVGRYENPEAIYKQISEGMWANYTKFEGHYNRSNEDYIESLVKGLQDESLDMYKARGIKLESIDDMSNTLDPIKSMLAEVTNVARMRNLNEWRDKWVNAWWDQFSELIPDHIKAGKSPLAAMSSPEIQMSVYAGDNRIAQFAESQRNYILQSLGAKTLDERLLETVMQRFTAGWSKDSKLFGGLVKGEQLITAGHFLRNADPLQFIRSFNFFTMLASFNPAQLIVQSAGALNAVAISPVHGLKAAYTAPLLRMALMSDNPKVWKTMATVEEVAKFGLGNADEFVDTVKMLKKSGLINNIVGTSMHSAEEGRFNMLTGLVSKAGEKTAFFFNRGEEFARITAFDTARREWIAANPGKVWNSDAALKEIMVRADNFTQNMTRSNLAFYQRGALSIPGQFLQYNIKLAANIVGAMTAKATGRPYRGFTMAEASSILGAHIVAYGLAGNGLMSMSDELFGGLEKLLGREVTDDEKLAFSQGAIASLVNEVSQLTTGEDLKLGLGERLGVFEYYDKIVRSAFSGDASFWEVVLGPTYGSASRLGALGNLLAPIRRDDYSIEGFAEAVNNTGREFVSTWRNATKAYYAASNDNVIMNKSKDAIVTLTTPEIIAQALGIGSAAEAEAWRLFKAKSDYTKEVKEIALTFVEVEWQRLQALNSGDKDRADKLLKFGTTLIPTLPGDKDLFWGEVDKHTGPYGEGVWRDKFTKARRDYLNGEYAIKDVVTTRSNGLKDVRPVETGEQ